MSWENKFQWILELLGQMGAAFQEIGAIIIEIITTLLS
jgi:hypothetical protein